MDANITSHVMKFKKEPLFPSFFFESESRFSGRRERHFHLKSEEIGCIVKEASPASESCENRELSRNCEPRLRQSQILRRWNVSEMAISELCA